MDDTNDGITGSPRENHHDLKAVAEYWTEERRKAAKPYPLPKLPAPKTEKLVPLPKGEPGHTPHGHGSEAAPSPHEAPLGLGGQAVAFPLNYPYRTVGKLFFTQGGAGYSGSAALVAPNVLLTAGHCVYNGGWSTNMSFYPSYGKRAANDPAYHFACGRLACRTSWIQHSDRAHDYGMVWIGAAPGNIVGWLGLLWNAPTAGRVWDAVGYPATPNPPFDGNTMDEAIGTVAASSTAGTIGLTNDTMEHGSSGGPWITAWNEANRTHANGVQSFHIHDGDTVEYGPYFTQEVQDLFTWISTPANH